MEGPPASIVVTVQFPARTHVVEIAEFTGISPVAQPLPKDRVLIVGGWAQWRRKGPDRNATIYGSDGSEELSACVGDGIEHVLATADGAVWIGYHDMGIFGNNGWGEFRSPRPIGAPGLVRFSPRLEVEWEFPGGRLPREHLPPGPIDECEAITLSGESLWAYYESSFPVVRVDGGQVRSWSSSTPGSPPPACGIQALATDGRRVALAGGYPGEEDRVVVARLEQQWVPERTIRLRLPDGSWAPGAGMQGFGDVLHVFSGQEWYQIRLDQL